MFRRHLKAKHNERYLAYESSKHKLASGGPGGIPKISSLFELFPKSDGSVASTYGPNHPKQKMLTRSIVENLIVKAGLPISVVECEGFKAFCNDIDPKLVVPCRRTVTGSILPQILADKHSAVSAKLSDALDVALTVDIWTDRRQHAFIGMTAHMFSCLSGKPSSLLVTFKSFKGSHTGESISQIVTEALAEYSIQDKVHYIVTDNASNMRKAIDFVFSPGPRGDIESWLLSGADAEDILSVTDGIVDDESLYEDLPPDDMDSVCIIAGERIPCFAHSLQLTVRDGLQKSAVSRTAVAKCAKIANQVHQSAQFKEHFEEAFGKTRSVPSSNETRWNSVFRQISCIVSLDSAKLASTLNKAGHANLVLSVKETQQLRELVDILEPFADATDLAQGSTYVTVSCVVPILLSLNKKLNQLLTRAKYHVAFVHELLRSLFSRFAGIMEQLQIVLSKTVSSTSSSKTRNLHFDSNIFLLSCSIDPEHAYHWLQLHPGSPAVKEALKIKIFGMKLITLSLLMLFILLAFS